MINRFFVALAAFFGFFFLIKLKGKSDKEAGKQEERADDLEGILDDIHQADVVRDLLDSDPEYHDRMREKFTRK